MLPALLQDHWQRVTSQLTDSGERQDFDWSEIWQGLSTEQQAQARRVLTVSQYVVDAIPRETAWFAASLLENHFYKPVTLKLIESWFDELTDFALTEDDWAKALRKLRRRAMVHIIWRDILRWATTMETTQSVSELADICVQRSVDFLHTVLTQKHGQPIGYSSQEEQKLYVIGMGKLGAHELNLSSDIDLIFAFPESGETNGRKALSNQEFFTKLGQKLIRALDTQTVDGFTFRVDMRLRPYGQSGPLVMNFSSLEEYYQSQGRDWERFAMVKARVLNHTQTAPAQELLSTLRSFTYRIYIDFSAIDSLRQMKAMINAEVRRLGLYNNIKLGPGGIREIEFIVQAIQVIRGGQDKNLQERTLLKVLNLLELEGFFPAQVCEELEQAYLFLRDTEHVLQALNDEQTQQLPAGSLLKARIALAMGYDYWEAFIEQLNIHRGNVSHHFAQVVAGEDEQDNADFNMQLWTELWFSRLTYEEQAELENPISLEEFETIKKLILTFRKSRTVIKMQQIGRQRLDALMPLLLCELWQLPEPKQTLERVLPLLEAVLRRTSYLVLLKENPQALNQLLKLCGASSWVAEYIALTPLLLDELLNITALYSLPTKQELVEELQVRLLRIDAEDLEQQMELLRQFVRSHKLRAAASEVMNTLTLMKVSDYLTWLAEAIIDTTVDIAWVQTVNKYGYPTDENGEAIYTPEVAVIGYGKLGGLELTYSSDLDLVLLHNSFSMGQTTGERSQYNDVFYTRFGQRIIHILTTQTRSGDLYDLDMRLRPSGNSGTIVTSLKAFAEYQQNHAWTWEHQALVRARAICGSVEATAEFERIRHETLSHHRSDVELREEVRAMRQKMVDNLGSKETSGQVFHLKQDPGGIVDVEFLVQYIVLAWSNQYPELLGVTDNMRLLDTFEAVGLMDPKDRQTLQEIYLSYRAETHRRALQKQNLILDIETLQQLGFDKRRDEVIRLWKIWLEVDIPTSEHN